MGDDRTDFERDAVSFILELGQKCGLKPQEAFQRLVGTGGTRLSDLRAKWVEEIDTMLSHARRERDEQKNIVTKLTNAIDVALIALAGEPTGQHGGTARVSEAERILERALGRRNGLPLVDGPETQGETP